MSARAGAFLIPAPQLNQRFEQSVHTQLSTYLHCIITHNSILL